MPILAFIAACVLAGVHIFADRVNVDSDGTRSMWLSVAGGITVAYVFLFLLPHLAEGQEHLSNADDGAFSFLRHHSYVVALLGLITFYGLERAAKGARSHYSKSKQSTGRGVFWAHMAAFFGYNLLIGYLLVHDVASLYGLILFTVAIGLHFLTIDYSLREHYPNIYHRLGRWILSLGVLLGWLVGAVFDFPQVYVSLLTAFLSGGIILNVLKEELPEERQSHFIPFLLAGMAFAVLLLSRQ